jgi:hypothetical protein
MNTSFATAPASASAGLVLMAVAKPSQRDLHFTRALAAQNAAWTFEGVPADARTLVRHCLLDWIAVTLAGAQEPVTHMLAEEAREQGGFPQATVVGHGFAASSRQAALINGAASHALDFDDVNMSFTGHPSVVLVPALLALAEARGASGAAFMTAFVAGYETLCRIGASVSPGHYALGFHSTGTIGTFGAAAACAHLLQLDAEDTADALGIAATQAAGLKAMFGSMCKPLHAGKAGADGMMAPTSTLPPGCGMPPMGCTCATTCSSITRPATARTLPSKQRVTCAKSMASRRATSGESPCTHRPAARECATFPHRAQGWRPSSVCVMSWPWPWLAWTPPSWPATATSRRTSRR